MVGALFFGLNEGVRDLKRREAPTRVWQSHSASPMAAYGKAIAAFPQNLPLKAAVDGEGVDGGERCGEAEVDFLSAAKEGDFFVGTVSPMGVCVWDDEVAFLESGLLGGACGIDEIDA